MAGANKKKMIRKYKYIIKFGNRNYKFIKCNTSFWTRYSRVNKLHTCLVYGMMGEGEYLTMLNAAISKVLPTIGTVNKHALKKGKKKIRLDKREILSIPPLTSDYARLQ